jgi:Bacterial Ig-like domain (group 3)
VINAGKTVGIPLNRFQGQGTFFEEVYAVSGDGFTDVNPNVTGLFPAFSASNTFAMFNDNTIDQSFVLPSATGTTPALAGVRGFGAIFINNEVASTSSIEYFHGDLSLGKFFVPVGTQGQPEFLGELFNDPIVTKVTLTLGTDVLFSFDGTTVSSTSTNNPPTHNLVVTDDFVYPEPVSILDATPILPGPNGTLNATPRATATVGTAFTGSVATFSDTDVAAKAAQFTATINWGDGHISNGTVQANAQGGFDVMGTNTYATARLVPTSVHIQDFAGSSDLDVASVIKVAAANTTTTLSVSPSSAIAGQTVTLTAQVTPSAGNTANNGFVLFQDNGLPLAVVPVDSTGAATFNTTKLSLGSHSLSASFLATPDFNASASTAVQKVVSADVTTQFAITLGSISRRGRRFVQHVTLKNNGVTLSDPLALVLDRLSRGVKLTNASGVTKTVAALGSPFVFISLGSLKQIASGGTVSIDLSLSARSARAIRYTPRILVGLSQP